MKFRKDGLKAKHAFIKTKFRKVNLRLFFQFFFQTTLLSALFEKLAFI